ncbi:cysteine ABC transporter permease [Facklamia sp. HMSC062C11]|uniref:amino acid ABC transporter permease n=1 Tax=Facklamia TaxID=66831 RepID=UPI0008A3A464|nr:MULTISPECIES: amino acid ABC transporter permease [Facklamia]OFL65744.1 cysteine ABC transporter permease [Facklamia sp. HMSC062C11]PKY93508.1 amino acid ABC transporter permease [Facklamia hominis]
MNKAFEIWAESFLPILETGLKVTIPFSIVVFILGMILATFVAIIRINRIPILTQIASIYIWIIRGTPLMVQLFIVFFGLPKVGITLPAIPAAVITYVLSVGAYYSETIRASILAVPKGQWEAAEALGLTYFQTFMKIVVPQAAKIATPTLANNFIALVKDSSLASTITVTEMMLVTQRAVARTYEPLLLYIEVAFVYLIFCTILTYVQGKLENKLTLPEVKRTTNKVEVA